jgi:Flp pilus assembly protein TadG
MTIVNSPEFLSQDDHSARRSGRSVFAGCLRTLCLVLRRNSGAVLLEAAFTIPLLIFLVLGGIELCRYVQFGQKLTDTDQKLVDLVNQNQTLSQSDIDLLCNVASDIMTPFDTSTLRLFVTSVQQDLPPTNPTPPPATNPADVLWQAVPTGQDNVVTSKIAPVIVPPPVCTSASPAACAKVFLLPNNVSLASILVQRDQIIAVEMYIKYTPFLNIPGITSAENLDYMYKFSFATPRFGAFQDPPSGGSATTSGCQPKPPATSR